MNITNLKIGQTGQVSYVDGNDKLTKRLLALGCTEGTFVKLKRKAPFGDPLVISIRGFDIGLRKEDAKNIFLK